jgi:hypothetical protein
MKDQKGAWFAGWGYMRFWLRTNASTPTHGDNTNNSGHGDEADYPGEIKAASWRDPYRATLCAIGA